VADFRFSSDIDWHFTGADVERQYSTTTSDTAKMLRKGGYRIVAAAKRQVGRDTGALASSIYFNIRPGVGGLALEVGADDDIALIHHEGTQRHLITPNRAQALRFTSRGRVVYARQVMHPGTAPNRFLSDNMYLAGL